MLFHTLMGMGFLGLALGGFGGGGPSPIGTAVGARTPGDFSSLVVYSAPAQPAAPAGFVIPNFKPSDFPFVTVVPDDGSGPSGWQEAMANLEFIRIVFPTTLIIWYCPITIGMPIRNSTYGKISLARAATMSVTVTNSVGQGMNYKLPQGIFCHRFRKGVVAAFPDMFPGLGERVTL